MNKSWWPDLHCECIKIFGN